MIATKNVRDVRDVVRSYDGAEDIAAAFEERLARLGGVPASPASSSVAPAASPARGRGLLGGLVAG